MLVTEGGRARMWLRRIVSGDNIRAEDWAMGRRQGGLLLALNS